MKRNTPHNCPGDGCLRCEQRAYAIEYERDHAGDHDRDLPDYYDGT